MKTNPIILSLVVSSVIAISIATTHPRSVAAKTGPAAFGQGEFTFNHELISFSFDTQANQKGHASGRAVFDNLSTQTEVVVRIDCLRVDSFEAVITGTVLHSNDPDFPKSTDVIFAAFDGQGVRSDTITPLFVNPFIDCNAGASPLTIFQVDGIVIQP